MLPPCPKQGSWMTKGAQLKCEVYLIQMHFLWGRNEVVHITEAWEGFGMPTSPTPPQARLCTRSWDGAVLGLNVNGTGLEWSGR